MRTKPQLEQVHRDIIGLKSYLLPLLNSNDPVASWKALDAIDFLDDWGEDVQARMAVLELNKPTLSERIRIWMKGNR